MRGNTWADISDHGLDLLVCKETSWAPSHTPVLEASPFLRKVPSPWHGNLSLWFSVLLQKRRGQEGRRWTEKGWEKLLTVADKGRSQGVGVGVGADAQPSSQLGW